MPTAYMHLLRSLIKNSCSFLYTAEFFIYFLQYVGIESRQWHPERKIVSALYSPVRAKFHSDLIENAACVMGTCLAQIKYPASR